MNVCNNMTELIGGTPLLRLHGWEARHHLTAQLYGKMECLNPAGSIKDRTALEMLNQAEHDGILTRDTVLLEPTSGNTGIGLAAIAAARGYRIIILMPDTMSLERQQMMRAYGAELVLTPGALGMSGAIDEAHRLAASLKNALIAGQFENPANPAAHYKTTGPEIWRDLDGAVDLLVASIGTGGTVSGTGRFLKEQNPKIRVVAVEPAGSPILSGGTAGAHKIQGIGAGFVPKALDRSVIDEIMTVTDDAAYETARALVLAEGVLCGISSGAALSSATALARRAENRGKRIVVILPDTGTRYLTTPGLYTPVKT